MMATFGAQSAFLRFSGRATYARKMSSTPRTAGGSSAELERAEEEEQLRRHASSPLRLKRASSLGLIRRHDAFSLITYLYHYKKDEAVCEFLCVELESHALSEIEVYLLLLCQFVLQPGHAKSWPPLERLLARLSARSMHVALQVLLALLVVLVVLLLLVVLLVLLVLLVLVMVVLLLLLLLLMVVVVLLLLLLPLTRPWRGAAGDVVVSVEPGRGGDAARRDGGRGGGREGGELPHAMRGATAGARSCWCWCCWCCCWCCWCCCCC